MTIKKFLPAAVLAVCCSVALVGTAMRAPMTPGVPVAVLFSPGTSLIEAIASVGAAGGRVERTGRWDNIVVASFDGAEPPVAALEAAGAWFVFNAIVAGGCDPVFLQAPQQANLYGRTSADEGSSS